jgi:hypothetical protein
MPTLISTSRAVMGLVIMACCVPADAGNRRTYVPGNFDYGEPTITREKARDLARTRPIITLARVAELTPEVARELVGNERGVMLTLPAVETLSLETARELARFKGNLRLWGVTRLTPDVARALAETKTGEDLDLSGVSEVSSEVAGILATTKVPALWLGVRELDADVARALVPMRGHLIFPDLETLSPDGAAELAKHKGPLNLGTVKLSREAALELVAHKGWLALSGVRRLEPGVGDILARHADEVTVSLSEIDSVALARKVFREPYSSSAVNGLETISPEIARALVQSPAHVSFSRLKSLTPEAASELAKRPGDIGFLTLATISPETAQALTDRPKAEHAVRLYGITALDGPEAVAVAEALSSTPGAVSLTRLKRVSADALAVLRTKSTIALPPDDDLKIVP